MTGFPVTDEVRAEAHRAAQAAWFKSGTSFRTAVDAALEAAARTAQPAPLVMENPHELEDLARSMFIDPPDTEREAHAWLLKAWVRGAKVDQLTATREKLTEAFKAHMNFVESYGDRDPNMPMEECLFCTCDPGEPLYTWVQTSPDDTSDERFRIAWADHMSAVLASGVVQEASAPVVDRDLMVETLTGLRIDGTTGSAVIEESEAEFIAENLAQAGVFKTEAEVRADERVGGSDG